MIDTLFATASRRFLGSAISREEGEFLRELASRPGIKEAIEVGCANGISSLYICSCLAEKRTVRHPAIAPFQSSDFEGRGAAIVQRGGFSFFQLIEKPSE